MVSEPEFQNTLRLLADYVSDMGDSVDEKFVENIIFLERNGEDIPLTGHRCVDDGSTYIVAGNTDLRSVQIVYFYSVRDYIAGGIEEEIANSIIDNSDISPSEMPGEDQLPPRIAASDILIKRLSERKRQALGDYLQIMTSGGDHHTQIYSNETDGIVGFNTSRMTFPYERDFGISDFYDAVTSVLESGYRGETVVHNSVFLNIDEENPVETELQIRFDW